MINQLDLPKIVKVDDYHEFDIIKRWLKAFGLKDIKYKELTSDNGYFAVFYCGFISESVKDLIKDFHEND